VALGDGSGGEPGHVVEWRTNRGRHRWHIENQVLTAEEQSGLNLEHAYSHGDQVGNVLLLVADLPSAVAVGGEGEVCCGSWPSNTACGRP